MGDCQSLFRGVFNYSRSPEILYRYAYSSRQAWFRMTFGLAEKHEVTPCCVRHRFPWIDGGKGNNYEIAVELEVKENDEN